MHTHSNNPYTNEVHIVTQSGAFVRVTADAHGHLHVGVHLPREHRPLIVRPDAQAQLLQMPETVTPVYNDIPTTPSPTSTWEGYYKVVGLLGLFDGNRENDFYLPDDGGSLVYQVSPDDDDVLMSASEMQQLYTAWGNQCW